MNTERDSGDSTAPAWPTGARLMHVHGETRLLRWHYPSWRAAVERFAVIYGLREQVARVSEPVWLAAYDRGEHPPAAVLERADLTDYQ